MPRHVDHAGRRRVIAEAVCRLTDEHGVEGVTLRDVAARAGVSMGAVQRCFATKEEMLVFALGHIGERIGERVRARLTASPAQSAATALGHAAAEVSLLDAEHRAEARIWLAFIARAAVSDTLAVPLRANYAALQEVFTRLVTRARADTGRPGEADAPADTATDTHTDAGTHPDPDTDADADLRVEAERAARTLLALADGLTAHVLIGHLTPQQAQDVLHGHLIRLWERPDRD
ncbi:TetR/AcrR family transcriptional regulator [Streptomyces sp. NBC_00239]|uniref:TetR/AcrR family transcriptional regulator n=1 Tax=Streptomyces sp. NBC_00239 TaxID=2903640 RepID=UPI002E2DBC40|nr:TetR/AcrR family transcriptional regulator [Streptomyces sp. NBC_00239]